MRIGIQIRAAGPFRDIAERVAELEKAGLDLVSVAEAYSFDAVSQLGYLAARTERVEISTGILQIYSRTPAVLAPLGRTREIVEICRRVWRREKLTYHGRHYQIPLPPERGTGLGKPLKLIDRPLRDLVPITIAAIGPKNVALAAEIAEGWEPIFFHPGKAAQLKQLAD